MMLTRASVHLFSVRTSSWRSVSGGNSPPRRRGSPERVGVEEKDLLATTDELKKSIELGDVIDVALVADGDDDKMIVIVLDTVTKYGQVKIKAESEVEALKVLERLREAISVFKIAGIALKRAHECMREEVQNGVCILLAAHARTTSNKIIAGVIEHADDSTVRVAFSSIWERSSLNITISCPLGVNRVIIPSSAVAEIVDGGVLGPIEGKWVDYAKDDCVSRMQYSFTFQVSVKRQLFDVKHFLWRYFHAFIFACSVLFFSVSGIGESIAPKSLLWCLLLLHSEKLFGWG